MLPLATEHGWAHHFRQTDESVDNLWPDTLRCRVCRVHKVWFRPGILHNASKVLVVSPEFAQHCTRHKQLNNSIPRKVTNAVDLSHILGELDGNTGATLYPLLETGAHVMREEELEEHKRKPCTIN